MSRATETPTRAAGAWIEGGRTTPTLTLPHEGGGDRSSRRAKSSGPASSPSPANAGHGRTHFGWAKDGLAALDA